MSYVLLIAGVLLAVWARSAVRRRPLWAPAMVGAELGLWPLAVTTGVAVVFAGRGWSGGVVGSVGLGLVVFAAIGFGVALVRTLSAPAIVRKVLVDATGETPRLGGSILGLVAPVAWRPRVVRVEAAVSYGPDPRHLLDRLWSSAPGSAPALVYVHGGGWWRGRRDTQARPMLYRLVGAGWQVFTPSYRLSPDATWPDHLIDVKRAIAWVRSHAEELGVDPEFVVIAGGSSGGNLAALAALTAGRVDLQPGFEDEDTSVQACVPIYGVHDLLRSDGQPMWPYLVRSVMKSDPADAPDEWQQASPIALASADRPPFVVVHGGADSLVPAELSRRLVAALRESGDETVTHLEVPGANHGFDFFAGVRGRATAIGLVGLLDHERERSSDPKA